MARGEKDYCCPAQRRNEIMLIYFLDRVAECRYFTQSNSILFLFGCILYLFCRVKNGDGPGSVDMISGICIFHLSSGVCRIPYSLFLPIHLSAKNFICMLHPSNGL